MYNHPFICSVNTICQHCAMGRDIRIKRSGSLLTHIHFKGLESSGGNKEANHIKPFSNCSSEWMYNVQERTMTLTLGWFSKSHSQSLITLYNRGWRAKIPDLPALQVAKGHVTQCWPIALKYQLLSRVLTEELFKGTASQYNHFSLI